MNVVRPTVSRSSASPTSRAFVISPRLALAGAHATIAYDDLDAAIQAIGPRVIIPMHYYNPRGWLQIEPVDSFLSRYSDDMITRVGEPQLELTPATLPARQHIYVLEQSR